MSALNELMEFLYEAFQGTSIPRALVAAFVDNAIDEAVAPYREALRRMAESEHTTWCKQQARTPCSYGEQCVCHVAIAREALGELKDV